MCLALFLSGSARGQAPGSDTILIGDTTHMYLTPGNFRLPCLYLSTSYTQQLVNKSELNGEAMITGIDFYCGTPSSTGCPGCTIYLANTYVSSMGAGMVGFGPMFQQVLVDSLVCTMGWNHYDFDTPFHYTGLGNLIIAADCPNGWSGGQFYCDQRGIIDSRYVNMRLANITPSTPTTAMSSRNIMRLHTMPVSTTVTSCPAPTLRVDSLGSTAVKMRWTPGYQDTSWRVDFITDGDTAWRTSGLLWGDTSYTITGLVPSIHYTLRLTAFCTDTFTTVLKHLLTNCIPTVLPYAEYLDSTWSVPGCWFVAPGTAGDVPIVSSRFSHSGSRSLNLKGGAVVLPEFDAPPDSLELYFWAKCNGGSWRDLYVGLVTDPLDLSTFVPLDTVSCYSSWIPVAVRTDRYPRSSGRLAIITADPLNPYMFIDDIEVSHLVPCEALSAATVDWKTDTAALIRWVDTVGAVYYDVAYGPKGFVPDSTTIVTDVRTDSLLLTGLTPYTQYDVYVRPECGSFTTHWSPVMTFRTFCTPLDTLPYVDNFDSYTGNPDPPAIPCWRGHAGMNTCVVNYTDSRSGSQVLRWDYEDNQYAVLPAIDTAIYPLRTLQLSFWACNNQYNSTDVQLSVGVMTDPDVDSTFHAIDTVTITGVDWRRYDVPLSSYTGNGAHITLRSITSDYRYAFIDDLMIDLLPPCPSVTGMAVTGLTATSVTVGWDPASGLTGPDSGTVWQTCIDTSATAAPMAGTSVLHTPTCTFAGLTTATPYYVWVRAICPKGDTSAWEGPMQVVPGIWNMRANRSDTLTMCGVSLYDDGGSNGDFTSQHSSLVILPDMPGHLASISGYCNIGGSSSLTIYDGVGTSGRPLWVRTFNYSSAINLGPIISETGALTIDFDGYTPFSMYYEGFELQVSCIPDTCIIHQLMLNPAVPATDSTLALTWQCNGASSYEVEYGPVGFTPGTGTSVSTSTNSLTVTGLTSLARCEVHVRSICGVADTGAWTTGIFNTQPCSNAVYRENFDSTIWEESHPMLPIGSNVSNYSFTQTIVDSAFLAGLEDGITALAFRPINHTVGDHQNNVTVYLANVPDTAFGNGPIVPDAGHRFVKVIDSANFSHLGTTEWQIVPFDHPFMWDGHQNLLVTVLNQDGGDGLRTEYASHYRYSDLRNNIYRSYSIYSEYPINIDSVATYAYPYYQGYGDWNTGDLRFYTNTCDLPLCAKPVVDTVVKGHESVTVMWNGSSTEYDVAIDPYGPATVYPATAPIHVSGFQHTFTGLLPNARYVVSLRQDCTADSLRLSGWTTVEIITDEYHCPAPEGLTVDSITYTSATFRWLPAGNDSLYQLYIWQDGDRAVSHLADSRHFTVEGLRPGTTYNASVHGYCGSEGQIEGSRSDTLRFATTSCPTVTGLAASAVTTTSVTLGWDTLPAAQEYLLEYGPTGFLPGQGTEVTISTNSYTVTGLTPNTAYDFWVSTRCSDDVTSTVSASLTNIRTLEELGVNTIGDTRFSFTLTPNPAKGSTMLVIAAPAASASGLYTVTVTDLAGRDVATHQLQCSGGCRTTLQLDGLSAGAYFVHVKGQFGSAVRKLIVK